MSRTIEKSKPVGDPSNQRVSSISEPGFYKGSIVQYLPEQNIAVVLPTGYETPLHLHWTSPLFSNLIGVKFNSVPSPGTSCVFYWFGNEGYVLSCFNKAIPLPQDAYTINGEDDLSATESGKLKRKIDLRNFGGNTPPFNLVDGEINLGFHHGVALNLLRNLSQLSAGDLAKVECHILDDMVRIISDRFSHITCFGDHNIYNDGGRLNVRWDGSLFDYEAYGLQDPLDPKAVFDTKFDVKAQESAGEDPEDIFLRTGRWRFTKFIGHIGNLIHMFVTDPVGQIGKIGEAALRSGRFNFHVNTDGSVLVQSVSDIVLERVVRIAVPIEKKRYEDPEGNVLPDNDLNPVFGVSNNPLANWVPTGEENVFETAYKIRDYARWFANYYSLANFHRLHKDWEVPTESQVPQPDRNDANPEKESVNGAYTQDIHNKYEDKYATIRIFKDGSILIMDTTGSTVSMIGGDVSVSATRDLKLEASRNVIITAGKDIHQKAHRHVEITAVTGGFLLRAKKWLQALCDMGSVLIESSADQDTPGERFFGNNGIILRTNRRSDILINSFNDLKIKAVLGGVLVSARRFVNNLLGGFFSVITGDGGNNQRVEVGNGAITAQSGKFERLVSKFITNAKYNIRTPMEGPDGHGSHVFGVDDDSPILDLEYKEDSSAITKTSELNNPDQYRFDFDHQTAEDYGTDENPTYESITQQMVRLDRLSTDPDFVNWTQDEESLPPVIASSKVPFPGRGADERKYNPVSTEKLNEPSEEKHFPNKGNQMLDQPWSFVRLNK